MDYSPSPEPSQPAEPDERPVARSAKLPPTVRGEIDLTQLTVLFFKRWRWVFWGPIAGIAAALVVVALSTPKYLAITTFVPETGGASRLPTALQTLVAPLGIPFLSDADQSPRFYAEVVRSRPLLERVLLTRYATLASRGGRGSGEFALADSITLLDALKVNESDSAKRIDAGAQLLRRALSTHVDNQTNIVRLGVELSDRFLAAQVANQFVTSLSDFNSTSRRLQARDRRRFVEARVVEAEHDLRDAEEQLRSFYERNRSWSDSPQLRFDEGRLRRQVDLRQDLYLTLKREFEVTRIEEVNDSPAITIIEPAVVPQWPSRPFKPLWVALGLVLGTLVGISGALISDFRIRATGSSDYLTLQQLVARARTQLIDRVRAVL